MDSASDEDSISGGGGMTPGLVFTFTGRSFRCVRAWAGTGEAAAGDPENRAKLSEVGDVGEGEADDALDSMLSSLIFVCKTMGSTAPSASYLWSGFEMALVDLEYGESSMGVTEMREEGESKDCERWMRIFGEGVRGRVHRTRVAIMIYPANSSLLYGDVCKRVYPFPSRAVVNLFLTHTLWAQSEK